MTSLFTAFVARGIEVPDIDIRLISHVDVREVALSDERPAAPEEVEVKTELNGDGTTNSNDNSMNEVAS